MRWPWQRQSSGKQLVVSWSDQTLAYVLASARQDGTHEVLGFGVERQGAEGGARQGSCRLIHAATC